MSLMNYLHFKHFHSERHFSAADIFLYYIVLADGSLLYLTTNNTHANASTCVHGVRTQDELQLFLCFYVCCLLSSSDMKASHQLSLSQSENFFFEPWFTYSTFHWKHLLQFAIVIKNKDKWITLTQHTVAIRPVRGQHAANAGLRTIL